MCYFIDLITLLCPTACASVAMNTDTPSDTSTDGEIQLNQCTLDAVVQSIAAKLQEATKPSEASTRPSTGEFGCGHIVSEVWFVEVGGFVACFNAISLKHHHLSKIAT